ncbi:hypothetical protein shim_40120 [Shimia sp. SK013]|uniref:hypothetical protein n=1 Tax=Shimia sp. SK013 TaxID=1389006 RepID=UPI0006B5C018|nr:hypothetical protein [Shimia sp. SK013]KPA20053.1 hypothetical protein shim_40120 [Shimia sp. SK013]
MTRLALIAVFAITLMSGAAMHANAQQERLIPLIDGRTCWTETSKRCFRYNEGRRSATRSGFGNVRVPADLEVKPGYITEGGFVAIERAISKQVGGQAFGR